MTPNTNLKEVAQRLGRAMLMAITVLLIAGTVNAQSKQKVAVYVTGDADVGTKKVIGAKMVSAITKDDAYAAVERTSDFLSELNKEQSYQQSGAVDDRQIAKLGQQFGVAFVIVTDVSMVYGSTFVSARMINVITGLIIATADRDKEVSGMADLTELSESIAEGLINNAVECNRKDQAVDKRGCCIGFKEVDGICRDVSGDMYWIDWKAQGLPPVKVETQGGVEWKNINIPEGYRLPTVDESKVLYKFFKQTLWTSNSETYQGYDHPIVVEHIWGIGINVKQHGYYECNYNSGYVTRYVYDGTSTKVGQRDSYTICTGKKYERSNPDGYRPPPPVDTYEYSKIAEISKPALAVFLRK